MNRFEQSFPLRQIRSDAHLKRANDLIAEIIKTDDLTQDEQGYLEVLGDLVHSYEQRVHALPILSNRNMLGCLMELRNINQATLAKRTKIAAPTISFLLSGKRKLNVNHIAAFAKYFKVSPAVFFEE